MFNSIFRTWKSPLDLTALLFSNNTVPLLIIIALISLIIQGFPIIFIQPRVGKNFKKFNIYKFRTIKRQGGILLFLTTVKFYKFLNGVSFFEKLN